MPSLLPSRPSSSHSSTTSNNPPPPPPHSTTAAPSPSPSSSRASTPLARALSGSVTPANEDDDAEEEEEEEDSDGQTPAKGKQPKSTTPARGGRTKKKAKKDELIPQLIDDLQVATDEALRSFVQLDECAYVNKQIGNVKTYGDDQDLAVCDCSVDRDAEESEQACGDDASCVNRLLQMECLPEDCRCGGRCQNQRFQKKQYAPIDIVKTDKKGFGVRATVDMIADTFIYEYIGEVIGPTVFARKMKEYASDGIRHFYFMALDKDIFIDATKKGGLGRFLNHSCNPNCVVAKWTVGKKMRMGIFTKRDVGKGEELTFNYNVDRYGHTAQECFCGEPNCVGFIGGKTQTDIGGMDDLYLDALGITDEVEALGLRGTKKKKGKHLDDDFIPLLKPIELDEVNKVAAAVRQALTTKRILEKLLLRINMTRDKEVQRQLLRLHGFNLMSHILKEYPKDVAILEAALEVLTAWPLMARNKVESSKIEAPVKLCAEMDDEPKVAELAKGLLEEWDSLEFGYRIPKALKDPGSERKRSHAEDLDSLSKRTRLSDSSSLPPPSSTRPIFVRPEATIWTTALPTVPAGWSVSRDTHTGRLKYYNQHTREETRTPPTGPAVPLAKVPAAMDVNDIVARVQKEEKEKKERERIEKEREEKERREKRKEAEAGVKDKKVMNLFSAIVVGVMSKYKTLLDAEQFKKRARELTTILCDKEKKHPNYPSESYDRLSPEKAAKVKAFAKDWVKKLIERRGSSSSSTPKASSSSLSHSHSHTPSASAATSASPPTPASTTPRPHHPSLTPATPHASESLPSTSSTVVVKHEGGGDTPPGTPPSKRLSLPLAEESQDVKPKLDVVDEFPPLLIEKMGVKLEAVEVRPKKEEDQDGDGDVEMKSVGDDERR